MNTFHNIFESWLISTIGISADSAAWLERLIIIAIILLISFSLQYICDKIFTPIIIKVTQKTKVTWDDYVFNPKLLHQFNKIIPAVAIYVMLPLAFGDMPFLFNLLLKINSIYILVMVIKLITVFISNLYAIKEEKKSEGLTSMKGAYQMVKLIIIFLGVIGIVSILLDKSPVALFAGLGAAATVLMLVFKDTIVGLVSGVQLTANDMLKKGDWISMPQYNCDGTVIEVSLTTVKVRNFDNTISTIPPYSLVSESFVNWRGMKESAGRRVRRSIPIDMHSISFCTAEQTEKLIAGGYIRKEDASQNLVNLKAFRQHMENYLRNLQQANKNLDLMVRELQPSEDGIPVEFYFFSTTKDWIPYEHLQADITDYAMAVLPQFGLRICQRYCPVSEK